MARPKTSAFWVAIACTVLSACQDGEGPAPGQRGERVRPEPSALPAPAAMPPPQEGFVRPPDRTPVERTTLWPRFCRSFARPIGLDEVTTVGFTGRGLPIGFSPRDLLRFTSGQRVIPLRWNAPFAGSTSLHMTIEATGGARFLDNTAGPLCPDTIEVDVTVRVTTADGILDETFASFIYSDRSRAARLEHAFDAPAIARIYAKQPGAVLPRRLHITSELSRYGSVGVLGATPSSGFGLAEWPENSACSSSIPVLNAGERPSVEDVAEATRGDGFLVHVDGARVPITMTPRILPASGCHVVDAGERLIVAADLELRPRTGQPTTVRVHLDAGLPTDGAIAGVGLQGFGPCSERDLLSVQEFLEQCGDWRVDLSGFHGAHLEVTSTGQYTAQVVVHGDGGEGCRRVPERGAGSSASGTRRSSWDRHFSDATNRSRDLPGSSVHAPLASLV